MIRIITLFWSELSTPVWLKFWDCVMMMPTHSFIGFFMYLIFCFAYLYFADRVLWLLNALGRRITIHEYKNIYNFKYCFKVVKDDHSGNHYFNHKWIPLWKTIVNLVQIVLLRQTLSKKKVKYDRDGETMLTDISVNSLSTSDFPTNTFEEGEGEVSLHDMRE
jgi:hypothetical protein